MLAVSSPFCRIDEQMELIGQSDVEQSIEREDLILKIEGVLKDFDERDQNVSSALLLRRVKFKRDKPDNEYQRE